MRHGVLDDSSADDPIARAHSDIEYCFSDASFGFDARVVANWLKGAVKKEPTPEHP